MVDSRMIASVAFPAPLSQTIVMRWRVVLGDVLLEALAALADAERPAHVLRLPRKTNAAPDARR